MLVVNSRVPHNIAKYVFLIDFNLVVSQTVYFEANCLIKVLGKTYFKVLDTLGGGGRLFHDRNRWENVKAADAF